MTTEEGLLIEVSANTTYSRSRLLPLFSNRVPWPDRVDGAMESMRRAARDVLRKKIDAAIQVTATWAPADSVFVEKLALPEDAPLAAVQDTLRERGELKTRLETSRYILLGAAAACAVGSALLLLLLDEGFVFAMYTLIAAAYALAFLPLVNGRLASTRIEIAETKERMELRGLLNDEERRAFRLYQIHNLDLKRYYDLALSQRRPDLRARCLLHRTRRRGGHYDADLARRRRR